MSNLKSPKLFFLLTAGLLAAPACRLDPPRVSDTTGTGGGSALCIEDPEEMVPVDAGVDPDAAGTGGGAGGSVGGAGGTGGAGGMGGGGGSSSSDINRVITPVACSGTSQSPEAVPLAYTPGYTPDPAVLQEVQSQLTNMSRADKIKQMYGTLFGDPFHTQFNDIQRSTDTATIRGFRYRDASRGVNFGEDMGGARPNAGKINNELVGFSTAYPVSMARGAAFDVDLEYAIGEAIGDEMQAARETVMLAPCMNLLRHPFWGRAQETYGEDPFLLGRLATAMTVGVQQHVAANAKHFMAYNIEVNRETINSELDEQTLREIYGRHFRMVVQDGGVASVMAAYNRVLGIKATQSKHLLTEVLRNDFGFKGFVLSDWWAMEPSTNANVDPALLKKYAKEGVEAGLDIDLPWALSYGQLESLIESGQLTQGQIDTSAGRVLEQKFRFKSANKFGPVGLGSPITKWGKGQISCNGPHIALSERAAIESMVLLKNDNGTLPIKPSVTKVAVVGATVPYETTNGGSTQTGGLVNFALDVRTGDLGSSRVYHHPWKGVGPFAGFCKAAGGTPNEITAADGTKSATCDGASITVTHATTSGTSIAPVMAAVADADFVVVVGGLTAEDEGEEYTLAGDRLSLALDAKQDGAYKTLQNDLISAVAAAGKPMTVILQGGAVIDMPWLAQVPSVVMAWYPGQRGGAAMAKLLWGKANFSAKLPLTWAKRVEDYDIWKGAGTTTHGYYAGYSWFDNKNIAPLYPFGHGLSYTQYQYKNLQLGCSEMSKGAVLPVVVNVQNTGTVAGDEIVMVWVSYPGTTARRPAKELKGFQRVHLAAGEEKQVTIPVRLSDLDYFKVEDAANRTGKWVVETGELKVMVGGSSTSLPFTKSVNVNGY